jgi:serine/threonine protein phosphatase PrpC/CRP-like cAMP-binding protein
MTRTDPAPHREPLSVTFSARTDVGLVRSSNEDNFLIDRKLRLYVVCDGLGGHASGEVASAAAVNAAREGLGRRRALLEAYEFDTGAVDDDTLISLLRDVVSDANAQIHDRGKHIPSQRGMGTTLSLLLVAREKAFLAHVGDSRIYRLRHGMLRQLSEDHSLLGELQRGLVVDPALLTDRAKNQITRAVGVRESVEVDVTVVELKSGDRFLLATDGLHGLVPESEIAALLGDNDISLVADRLVDLANARGGTDNITAVALEIEATPTPSVPRRIWPDFDALRAAPVFRQLNDHDLSAILESAQPVTLGARDPLLSESRPIVVPGLFMVLDGDLMVRRGGEPVASLRVGDTFGEESLFIERTNTVDLVAGLGGARLLLLERARFEALAIAMPERVMQLALAIARSLSRKIDATVREVGVKVVYQPSAYQSRPTTRPATSPRLLVDTEPEPPKTLHEFRQVQENDAARTLHEPPELPRPPGQRSLATSTAVMRRPRAPERRIYPSQTMPAPDGEPDPSDDPFQDLAPAATRMPRNQRATDLPTHLTVAPEPPPLPLPPAPLEEPDP